MKALSEYQQAVLNQLDIVQWRLRDSGSESEQPVESVVNTQANSPESQAEQSSMSQSEAQSSSTAQKVNLDSPLAQDVLLALQALEHNTSENFAWQLGDNIQVKESILVSPQPEQLQTQPQLKKQLWNVLQQWQN